MNADGHRLPKRRKIKFITISTLFLLIFYILSIGPIAKLDDRGLIGENANKILEIVYAPLELIGKIPRLNSFFDWYILEMRSNDNSLKFRFIVRLPFPEQNSN